MDLNHDSATERYSEALNSALNYFSSLAQSSSGWKRLSSSSVRSPRTGTGNGSSGSLNNSGGASASSSPNSNRQQDDPMAHLPGGSTPSSAASAAIESLLPAISVAKKSVPGKSAEIVRATIVLPGLDEQTDLEDWRAVLECTGARKIWDRMVESSTVMQTLDDNTCITKTIFKTNWPASPRDALLIETTLLDHNAVLHIATSIKPSHDDPIFLRPSPPHVRAYLPLVAWHIQLVPADLDDTVSFTSFNSLTASQHKPVMPRHSIRVSFYYQLDMRGWAVNSSVSMQSHVPSCIANVYRLLRRQGVPPHVSRHSQRIQLDLNEYDPATGIYELRYDVISADSDDMLTERRTVSSAVRQFRLGKAATENGNSSKDNGDGQDPANIPQEIVLSDDDEMDESETDQQDGSNQVGYVDVELDGEKWGLGSDIVVHIFMNDIEDEEFVQEHVECLKYMGRDRYILRMKHSEVGSHHGAVNVKLRVERLAQQLSGGGNLLSHQQLRSQRQQQEQEQRHQSQLQLADLNGLVVSVNGHEKDILPLHRSAVQGTKRVSMSLQEQLELSQQIVQQVGDSPHAHSGSDGAEGQDLRPAASPLLLMSSSMPTTMQSLARSNQSVLSNGTSTMTPGNTNPSKVNNSYGYFNSLLLEPLSSWKPVSKQRGVQISKLDMQGHAPGIVKGEGVFEDFSIWDIKAALDCSSARKIWDKLFDESHMLQQATPSSILSYVRLKGFWPTSPKDMAVLNTTFITKDAIHYFATSVDDTNQFPSIPPPVSPFVRSELVVSGWFLEAIKPRSVRIVFIAQAAPTGWVVPGTALSAMTTEMPLCVAEIVKYLETFGSPPTLVSIRRGRALDVDYSHEKSTFRLEYVQDSSPIFSGHRTPQLQQQQQQSSVHSPDRQRRSTVDYSGGAGVESHAMVSPKLGPTDKLLAEIRLDARIWAKNGDCDITIDPPPSKVTCTCVPHDGTGFRLRIEHSSGRAVPAGGKVLVMARKPAKQGCGVVVNGVAIKMPSMAHLESWASRQLQKPDLDLAQTVSTADSSLADKEGEEGPLGESEAVGSGQGSSPSTLASPTQKRSPAILLTPLQYAQGALDLLIRINRDSEESWTVVSDSKNGMKVTKRFMPAEISDQVPLVRGEKVIEGFSLEEIATVIGTLGTRSKLDDLFESGEMLESFGAGCAVYHHVLKSYFPLPLPARDLYFVTVTASVEAAPRCPQIMIVSTSIPYEVQPASTGPIVETSASLSPSTAGSNPVRPRAHLHLSAWVLERIDPYSSSHPIPSTRVTYMTALDLGGSVPQRISGLLQTTFPKMISQVESYLQLQAAPPIVRIPEQMLLGPSPDLDKSNQSMDDETLEKVALIPTIVPWHSPTNKMLTWEFKMKDSFFQMLMLFDQFQLKSSRLDVATQARTRRAKKNLQKEERENDSTGTVTILQEAIDKTESEGSTELMTSRTVVELVIDLKQYPLGYNIITNVKVDPEFLLLHKQQRDSGQRLGGSLLGSKLAGSSSSANLKSMGSVLFGESVRPSLDLEDSLVGRSSEAASTGTGIAAVLGSSANLPRALPSSTSLIRILPPPITVKVIDIPPAPSHSSSLSGVSKRRKHLVIITVPEAEVSQSHGHGQLSHLLAGSSPSPATGSTAGTGVIRSTATAKPVVTTNTVAGMTSATFAAEDRAEARRAYQSSLSSPSNGSLAEASKRPSEGVASPGPVATSAVPSPRVASGSNTLAALETRMFQFNIKIDRLEPKDKVSKDTDTATNDSAWPGRVMVDGLAVEVLTGWSRQELGFMDGMMDEMEEGSEVRQSPSLNRQIGDASEDAIEERHSDGAESPKTVSRRRRHHRQQLANQQGQHPLDGPVPAEIQEGSRPRTREEESAPSDRVSTLPPTSSMSGLSSFLMNVGLFSSPKSSKSDSRNSLVERDGRGYDRMEDEDLDDDRTIRASKGVSRGGLGNILHSKGSNKSRTGNSKGREDDPEHDLDLESLHGSIVFKDRDHDTDQGYVQRSDSGQDDSRVDQELDQHLQGQPHSGTEWSEHGGSLRRRKGKEVLQNHRDDFSSDQHGEGSHKQQALHRRRRSQQQQEYRAEAQDSTDDDGGKRLHRPRERHGSGSQGQGRRAGSTNGADHPRFRGSHLYAYSFRNLLWSALACFLAGLLLRIYVIGPSFLKSATSSSTSFGARGSEPTAYYYYYAVPRSAPGSTRSHRQILNDPEEVESTARESLTRSLGMNLNGGMGGSESGRPQGMREIFTLRRVLGWDLVLLAYPSDQSPRSSST